MPTITAGLLSKSASAYEHIRGMAVRGELRPDRRLSPPDLAQVLRISVTPVREALARLAAEGFVRGEDGRGFFTKPRSVDEQRDLERLLALGLLASLHPDLAPPARVTPGLSGLETAFADAADRSDPGPRWAEAIGGFIVQAAAASGDAVLAGLLRNAADRSLEVRGLGLQDPGEREAELDVLRALSEAALRGDTAASAGVLRRRMERLTRRLPALVEAANARARRLRFP